MQFIFNSYEQEPVSEPDVGSMAVGIRSYDQYTIFCRVWKKWYYLPTPPLGQDMTQGQFFLSGV